MSQQALNSQELEILGLQKFENKAIKFAQLNTQLQSELQFYRTQTDRLKIALVEYDLYVRQSFIDASEQHIAQLDAENAHLRKLLNIPKDLFVIDEAEEKMREK